jgi:peptidoglycan/xylan/chitin deacetylase (PgdA/CDA1 family)
LIVLGWHNVQPTWCFPADPGASEKGLERQLRTLRAVANVVPLESALEDLRDGRPLPPRAVAVTFDDGYRDNLELAGPILRRLRMPATCFLVPGLLDGEVSPWWEELAWIFRHATGDEVQWAGVVHRVTEPAARHELFKRVAEDVKRLDRAGRTAAVETLRDQLAPTGHYDLRSHFMDWDEARRLQEYMSIGSHTMYHAILANETPQAQRDDLAEARRRLEEGLGSPIRVLAYPNGKQADYDEHTRAAADAAGYSFSITTRRGVTVRDTPRHDIPRWVMNPPRGPIDLTKVVRDVVRDRAA